MDDGTFCPSATGIGAIAKRRTIERSFLIHWVGKEGYKPFLMPLSVYPAGGEAASWIHKISSLGAAQPPPNPHAGK